METPDRHGPGFLLAPLTPVRYSGRISRNEQGSAAMEKHSFDGRFTKECKAVVLRDARLGQCGQPREAHK